MKKRYEIGYTITVSGTYEVDAEGECEASEIVLDKDWDALARIGEADSAEITYIQEIDHVDAFDASRDIDE